MKRTTNPDKNRKIIRRATVLVAAVITALALVLGLTLGFDGAKRVSVDNAEQGEVLTSTSATYNTAGTYNFTTTAGTITTNTAGKLANGDYLYFEYSGGIYTIVLPKGTYTLTVYGAQGGPGGNGTYIDGGLGGSATGTLTLTDASTTLYVYVGGQGTRCLSASYSGGGWNGGGSAFYYNSSGYYSGGGGGATDIRKGGSALSNRIIVAGGGGGTGGGGNQSKIGGAGGGTNGYAGGGSSANTSNNVAGDGYGGSGGTQSGGGAVGNTTGGGSAGSLGQGGNGCNVGNSWTGGGGGGGYYGGGGGGQGYGPGGGGGSGYTGGVTGGSMSNGVRSGNGRAVINVVNVNQDPATKSYTTTLQTRGTSIGKTVYATDLASDPDGTATAVYFTDGNSSNYDTYTSTCTTNNGLYLNSACTVSANKYFTWTFSGNSSFTINGVNAYPREGETGVVSSGKVRVYARIRDAYGTTTTRGCSVISFDVTVPKNSMSLNTRPNATVVNSAGESSQVECMVGSSTSTSEPGDPTAVTSIYNPNGTGRTTLFVKNTLMLGGKITIDATQLISGVISADQAVITLSDQSKITGSTRKFKVTQLDSGSDAVTAVPSSGSGTIPNTYSRISLECVTPTPGYQSLPVTLYVLEKAACNGSNVALWDKGSGLSYTVELVFKMENTRPVLKDGVDNVVEVGVGEVKSLKLNTYYTDIDNAGGISSSTHRITEVIVPKHEFVALNKLEEIVGMGAPNSNYYNKGSVTSDTFEATAQTDRETGFKDEIVYNTSQPNGIVREQAFMTYTYSDDTVTVTGLRTSYSQYTEERANDGAPGHFYLMLHIRDNCDASDDGIWLPLAFRVGGISAHNPIATVESTTELNVTLQSPSPQLPTASGSVGDEYYFAPMTVNYNGTHVVGQYKRADGTLTNAGLQALAMDGDNFSTESGTASWNGGKINELVTITSTPEQVVQSACPEETVRSNNGVWENRYFKAENIDIYLEKSMFSDGLYGNGRIIAGSGTNTAGYVYVDMGPVVTENGTDYYKTKGIKITLKSATMNRYVYASVGVKDASGATKTDIDIAVRVNNTKVSAYSGDSGKVATFGNSVRDSSYSTYTYDGTGTPTVTYKIPLGGTAIITPYDVAWDYDMQAGGVRSGEVGFTLNGYSGRYNATSGVYTVNSTSSIDGTKQIVGLYDGSEYNAAALALLRQINGSTKVRKVSATTDGTAAGVATNSGASVPVDGLYFERVGGGSDAYTYEATGTEYAITTANTTGFVEVNGGTKVKIENATYSIDYIVVSAQNRTTQRAVIDLEIRDRYGSGASDGDSSIAVRIIIEVVNTKPQVKNGALYRELSVKPVVSGETTVTPSSVKFGANGNGNETGLMTDPDRDEPSFIVARDVAVVNKRFIDEYEANTLTEADGHTKIDSLYLAEFDGLPTKYLTDNGESDGTLLTSYVTGILSSRRELTVTAVSSTKAIAGGVYVAFFATDNNGGVSLGYVRIEVINTVPVLNVSEENGFNTKYGGREEARLWSIESTSAADITRKRYIVGSTETAELVKQEKEANASDVKVIATDEDGLHDKIILSQRKETEDGVEYPTLEDGTAQAVPSTGSATSFNDENASAVKIYTRTASGDSVATVPGAPKANNGEEIVTATLHFYVNNKWYTRAELITELEKEQGEVTREDCFDESGRFTVADWALELRATTGFESNVDLGIVVSLRDQAEKGGSTAGQKTAYHSDRANKTDGELDNRVAVNGELVVTVYEHISQTGIRSINEYLGKNANYYTVEYAQSGSVVNYISTYDEATQSAGANTGKAYTSGMTEQELEGAFRYSDTIEVPAALAEGSAAAATGGAVKYATVYVPMSYFGLKSTLATLSGGDVTYSEDFVGYELEKGRKYTDFKNAEDILKAMTLSDGTNEWTGARIKDNPYIEIGAFDWTVEDDKNSALLTEDEYSKAYYNNRLAVLTEDAGKGLADNKNIQYLEEQATEITEHNFGLTVTKKNVRTGTRNLTLKISLVRWTKDKTIATKDGEIEAQDKCTAEVKIHVENSKLDLYSSEDRESSIKYDKAKGTYYADVTLKTSQTVNFELARRAAAEGKVPTPSKANADTFTYPVEYYDDDYNSASGRRDYAYFSSDSFNRMSQWQAGAGVYNRVMTTEEQGETLRLSNVIDTEKAQSSMKNYLGVTELSALSAEGSAYKTGAYTANDGIYGSTTGKEGYSSYFNAALTEGGATLSITPVRKTFINAVAFDSVDDLTGVNTGSKEEVKAAYLRRGLVAEYADGNTDALKPDRVYYPFKVIIYDSTGAGISDASYVGLELRITVVNGDPTLREVGEEIGAKQYSMNLAVGNFAEINVYDIVYDADMYTVRDSGVTTIATRKTFESRASGVVLETGDYLDSPIKRDENANRPYGTVVQKDERTGEYYCDGGGFVGYGTEEYKSRDVVMWMATEAVGDDWSMETEPTSNVIRFTVNHRTTAMYEGKSVTVNKYKFTLRFYDSLGERTDAFTFVINIANQAPTVTQVDRSFTMRVGDDMTLLTSYYDVFTGAGDESTHRAYENSATSDQIARLERTDGYGVYNGDGSNNATGNGRYWVYKDITTDKAGGNKVEHDSTTSDRPSSAAMHLGYIGLATDDTPWQLRITSWPRGNSKYTVYTGGQLALAPETGTTSAQQVAVRVVATAACTNEPLTVVLSDGEGGEVSCTLYLTIVSAPPVPRDYADSTDRTVLGKVGLEGVGSSGGYAEGTYRLFTVPASGEQGYEYSVASIDGTKTAKSVTKISMSDVAKDTDGDTQTNNMRLYGNGEFTVNGVALVSSADGVYRSEYFNILPSTDGKSFTITATGYNPTGTRGYEILTFRIADYGNNAYENTLVITLHVYTLYSDLTNPSAAGKTSAAYTDYLKGAEVVNVKAYDEFFDPENPNTEQSKYAYIQLAGNDGNDGNEASPIRDPDATKVGDASYDARLYAFIDVGSDGKITALTADALSGMLERDGNSKTFRLKPGEGTNYLIGGLERGERVVTTPQGEVRLQAVNKYASFEFTTDGTGLLFTPAASTLNSKEIILYVEAEKYVSTNRAFGRTGATLRAGSLFRLNVKDSAPTAVGGSYAASGVKGDEVTFSVYDETDRFGALFTDSDNGDRVRIYGIENGKLTEAEYENVMKEAEAKLPGLDWRSGENGKPRAIDITEGANGELKIKINRRVDYVEDGKYAASVTLPLKITGVDRVGEKATNTVYLTISNTDITAVESYTRLDGETGVGYTFTHTSADEYVMDVRLRANIPLEISIADVMRDSDVSNTYDGDSYRYVALKDAGAGKNYITDEEIEVKWYGTDSEGNPNIDDYIVLASATPVGKDSIHRTGLLFNATKTNRDLTATVYVRVIDRAGNEETEGSGLVIKINVLVMNSAPYVKDGMESTTLYMVGSEKENSAKGVLFYIGDFVTDDNESDVVGDEESGKNIDTCLRIARNDARTVDKIYSIKHDSVSGGMESSSTVMSSALLEVSIPGTLDQELIDEYKKRTGKSDLVKDTVNRYNQWFVVKPRSGYYGSGAIDITVMDGDPSVKFDSLSTTFCINVHVISNPEEVIDRLTDVEIACGKSKLLDVRTVMPELENKLKAVQSDAGTEDSEKAEAATHFSQSEYYEIVGMSIASELDANKATFGKLSDDGQIWEVKAGNQVTRDPLRVEVNFALKSDKTVTYKKYYYLNIVPNQSPKIKYSEIVFKRYGEEEGADALRDLSAANSIRLQAWQLCEDADDPDGTAIKLLAVESSVSSIVKANLVKDESGEYRYLELTFVARGESEITLTVTDETGTPVQLKFKAGNTDLPEASLWVKLSASFEANTIMWIGIIIAAAVLLIILILIFALLRKRKREREEVEALLVSEMEIEEQMLRLTGGATTPGYMSYGYLPGAAPTQDPSMMLGAGETSPQQQLTALPPAQDNGDGSNTDATE